MAPVLRAFEQAIDASPGGGGAVAIYIDGDCVLDAWSGLADRRHDRPWAAETASVVFSCTKGLLAILTHRLVERGLLDLDATVATYWPEFMTAGKAKISVSDLLTHRAGLAAFDTSVTFEELLDWERMITRLEAQKPLWTPGSAHSYHAITYGWLIGEVLRRVTGETVDALFDDIFSQGLGAEVALGAAAATPNRAHVEVGRSSFAHEPRSENEHWERLTLTLGGALPVDLVGERAGFNRDDVLVAGIPSAGGVATARGLAKVWSATVRTTDGVRLLDDATIAEQTRPQSEGQPYFAVPGPWPRWASGYMLTSDRRPLLSAQSFGHDGAGGQLGFADPKYGVGFGFVTNWLSDSRDQRANSIVHALRSVLEG
ncbi:serine hydrolase domain-containing protein [Microbacterium sp. CIAB417]|uniref:serine hydrolase domain-containing protein n=1 Tax=Microbacterium sp. CIAB417 TaxID=2860287 RepID=UPI001FAD72B1|nr:serine hydrolase domain-containing protein [Microbacterium sp. CIAB417]